MKRILICGAGMTGSATASMLSDSTASISVWEMADTVGGRMARMVNPLRPECFVDAGAQYISKSQANRFSSHYASLVSDGMLKELNSAALGGSFQTRESLVHYVAPKGLASVVSHFLERSKASLKLKKRMNSLRISENGSWIVTDQSDDNSEFDVIILTMPVPEVQAVKGAIQDILDRNTALAEALSGVRYSSRYVLALFFAEAFDLGLGGCAAAFLDPDSVKVGETPPFRFVSACNLKRGQTGPTSVVLHTAVLKPSLETLSPDLVRQHLLSQARELFPEWPQPEAVECKLWRYSQVLQSFPQQMGDGCVVLSERPLLVLGGDAFAQSNFEGCLQSAESISNVLKEKHPEIHN